MSTRLTGAQKNHEYEVMNAQKKKTDAYEQIGFSGKLDEYKTTGAQKSYVSTR